MVTAIQPGLFENSIEWASVSIDLEYYVITFYMIRRRYTRNPKPLHVLIKALSAALTTWIHTYINNNNNKLYNARRNMTVSA